MAEFYQGVLFLTTNRDEQLDLAFQNRVHITLKYDKLPFSARAAIWRNLIESNPSARPDESWTEEAYELLAEIDINVCTQASQESHIANPLKQGRTIKNLLCTAAKAAQADGEGLGVKHVVEVISVNMEDATEVVQKLDALLDAPEAPPLPAGWNLTTSVRELYGG